MIRNVLEPFRDPLALCLSPRKRGELNWFSGRFFVTIAIFGWVILGVVSQRNALAAAWQNNSATQNRDRPAQRWLPIPSGDSQDLTQQLRSMQQLRDMVSGLDDSLVPEVSKEKLQELERMYEQWRKQAPDPSQLPSLDEIPPEWIERGLQDPVMRSQAKRLLEQYAKDRRLPSSDPSSPVRGSGGVPLLPPSESSSENSIEKFDERSPDGSLNRDRSESPRNGQPGGPSKLPSDARGNKQSVAPEGDSSAPTDQATKMPDAERLRALQDLFKKLSTENSSPNSPTTDDRIGNQTQGTGLNPRSDASQRTNTNSRVPLDNSDRQSRSSRSSLPQKSLRDQSLRGESIRGEAMQGGSGSRSSQQDPSNSPSEGSAASRSNVDSRDKNDAVDSSPAVDPLGASVDRATVDKQAMDKQAVDAQGRRGPARGRGKSEESKRIENPFESPSAAGENRTQGSVENASLQERIAEAIRKANSNGGTSRNPSQVRGPSKSSSGITAPEVGDKFAEDPEALRDTVDRFGLGAALRRIVDEELKEQGEDSEGFLDSLKNIAQNAWSGESSSEGKGEDRKTQSASQALAQPAAESGSSNSGRRQRRDSPSAEDVAQSRNANRAKSQADSVAPRNSGSMASSNQQSGKPSEFGQLAADFWKAISTVPDSAPNANPTASSSADTAAAPSISGDWQLGWFASLVLAFSVVFGIAMVFLIRGRVASLLNPTPKDHQIAEQVLRSGIASRLDVIRAFHRLALGGSHGIANWWTHGLVANRLAERTPQWESAIQELTAIYVEARYLPAETDLSHEQLERARAAVHQCATAGA